VKLKTTMGGKRTTIMATEMRCAKTGDLMKIDANLNNDSKSVKRIAYKFRWIDREGMRAADEESWKPLMMYENSNMVINTISPSNKAADFRLILRSEE
ncbi:MAG TPA: YcfL family protein, partial [Burkholderiales bacterium]|nr:YcfL family protein [Burkholderiales bacterium]